MVPRIPNTQTVNEKMNRPLAIETSFVLEFSDLQKIIELIEKDVKEKLSFDMYSYESARKEGKMKAIDTAAVTPVN